MSNRKMEVFLDDGRQVFFPGAIIYGVFCVNVDSDPKYIPVIRAKGYTLIWKPGTNKETDEYSLFFEDKAAISSEGDSTNLFLNNEMIQSYSKTFYFHIVLPSNLPPSHEVPFGHTRYKIDVYYNGHTIFKYFSVNQWVGLKKRNNAIVKHENIASSFDFCRSIRVTLMLDQSYYLPGETAYVGAVIINNSWKDVMYSKMCIIQTTKYRKSHHLLPIKYTRVVAEEIRGQVCSGKKQIWNKQPFYIPAIIPTTHISNNPFNFFEVNYKIKMQIVLNNSKKYIILKQKLFIGNWDKSITTSRTNADPATNNGKHEIMVEDCRLIRQENNDFVPKYLIYETN